MQTERTTHFQMDAENNQNLGLNYIVTLTAIFKLRSLAVKQFRDQVTIVYKLINSGPLNNAQSSTYHHV